MKDKSKPSSKISSKESYKLVAQELGDVRVKFDEELKYQLNSGSVANAQCFYIATTVKELIAALNLAKELNIPFFVFGSGTKVLISEDLEGLTIKNRTSGIKVSGVKGKVSANGIGVAEAMVEIESGVSLQKVNEFLKDQGLKQFTFPFIPNATVGGSLFVTPDLQDLAQKVKVWSDGEVSDIEVYELKRNDIILSIIIKVKAAD